MTPVEINSAQAADYEDLVQINRSVPTVAQHDPYLLWLCCTLYNERCFVARGGGAEVVGYILSLPDSDSGSEFLLQIVVRKEWRKFATGKLLLSRHWQWLREAKISRVRTSIATSCREGFALMRIARGMGHRYNQIEWPIRSMPVPRYATDELLFEAHVTQVRQ